MRVVLSWPSPELSPNARAHWAKKALKAKRYRSLAFFLARLEGLRGCGQSGHSVLITFHPPDNRRRDLDNMLASIKSGLDGIASAIGVDDSKWAIKISRGDTVKGGAVVVEVSP